MTTETRTPAEIAASLTPAQRETIEVASRGGVVGCSLRTRNTRSVASLERAGVIGIAHDRNGWPYAWLTELGRAVAAALEGTDGTRDSTRTPAEIAASLTPAQRLALLGSVAVARQFPGAALPTGGVAHWRLRELGLEVALSATTGHVTDLGRAVAAALEGTDR